MYIFEPIVKFLDSLVGYLSYNAILVIFAGLFLLLTLIMIITTSKAYECKLIKAVDSFNNYFMDNPQITDENLVAFNQRMKSKKVPKQLRKQWQQYVLYREEKASYYMSFENCVANPLKNSSFKRDIIVYNVLTWALALVSFVLNLFFSFEIDNVSALLQHVLLCPVLILLVYFLVRIFLEVRHSAIVSDLFQNYQYFETNIDKATKTLPEYVDYEVLFDRAEIKKGIPILYAYLSKRAEQEQRELELARLKNIEHEQFNFDEAGVAGSLVLERAMQEAENYIAERKKYNQDTEQINADITQEELNYREITKEYNRQMQVSRETFENFKSQLNDVSSTIEANYLKKQQQQELDRQRNLERDFDAQTERHKKVLESFQAELDSVDKFRGESRKTLEDAMMSEFKTYNIKVFAEAKKIAEEQQNEKFEEIKAQVKELEEKIVAKNNELENAYAENQALSEKLISLGVDASDGATYERREPVEEKIVAQPVIKEEPVQPVEEVQEVETNQPEVVSENNEVAENEEQQNEVQETYNDQELNNNSEEKIEDSSEEMTKQEEPKYISKYFPDDEEEDEEPQEIKPEFDSEIEEQQESENQSNDEDEVTSLFEKYFAADLAEDNEENTDQEQTEKVEEEKSKSEDDVTSLFDQYFGSKEQEESNEDNEDVSTEQEEESEDVQEGEIEQPKRRVGRPRKIKTEEENTEPKKRGRPRKQVVQTEETPKRRVGRPRKEDNAEEEKVQPKRRGRPRKEETKVSTVKRKAGRPRKSETKEEVKVVAKRKAGRPKKTETKQEVSTAKKAGRPRKVKVEETKVAKAPTKRRGRPRKEETKVSPIKRKAGRPKKVATAIEVKSPSKGRGRPKKTSSVDIDAYLKEIDNEIAKENAKIKETRKQLEKKAKISKRKK